MKSCEVSRIEAADIAPLNDNTYLASATMEGLDLSCIDALKPPPFKLH